VEDGSRSLGTGVSVAWWGGLSGAESRSASGAKPALARLRSVGPAGDISWEPHCSCVRFNVVFSKYAVCL